MATSQQLPTIPYQITFLDIQESDVVRSALEARIQKLEHLSDRILRCEVVISCPHRHRHADRLYHLQIRVSLPGEDVAVTRNPDRNESHRDVYVAIRDSFTAVERILLDKTRIMQRKIKHHEPRFKPESPEAE